MTEKLYDSDSHCREFAAVVRSCKATEKGYAVILDQTAFFPEAGGQASDKGTINGIPVLDVQIEDEEIIHYTSAPISVGLSVTGVLDWERRFDFMQNHSGEHIISGIVYRLYGLQNVGFHLSEDEVTLDFDGILSEEQLTLVEDEANKAIYENAEFFCYYPTDEELASLSYRSKKELDGRIRIVEIKNYDICACCAPHIKSAAQIGIIKLLDTEKVRGGIRIWIKCGYRALRDYRIKYSNIKDISCLLSAKQHQTFEAVERLKQQLTDEKHTVTELKKRLISLLIDNADSSKTAFFQDGLDRKELQLYADGLHKRLGGMRAVFSRNGTGTIFAICGKENESNDFFTELKGHFTVNGGGRNGFIQGNIEESYKTVELYFHFDK